MSLPIDPLTGLEYEPTPEEKVAEQEERRQWLRIETHRLRGAGVSHLAIARRLNISIRTVYRLLAEKA